MSERTAEFLDLDDANRFRRMKGAADYDVVAGINLPWAVMPKIRYATNLGRSDEAPDSEPFTYDEDDDGTH